MTTQTEDMDCGGWGEGHSEWTRTAVTFLMVMAAMAGLAVALNQCSPLIIAPPPAQQVASVAFVPPGVDPQPDRTACIKACTTQLIATLDHIAASNNDGETKAWLTRIAWQSYEECKAACPAYVPVPVNP